MFPPEGGTTIATRILPYLPVGCHTLSQLTMRGVREDYIQAAWGEKPHSWGGEKRCLKVNHLRNYCQFPIREDVGSILLGAAASMRFWAKDEDAGEHLARLIKRLGLGARFNAKATPPHSVERGRHLFSRLMKFAHALAGSARNFRRRADGAETAIQV